MSGKVLGPKSEWLELHLSNIFTQIMQKNVKNFVKICDFKMKPAVATGENFMSLLFNVIFQIELKDGTVKELSYIIKQLPENQKQRDMLIDWKVFDKELNTYLNYIPEFESMYREKGKNIHFGPGIFTTNLSSGQKKEMIIMEDLREKGFKNIKRQEGLDISHTKHALEKLAQFHAASACRFVQKGCFPVIYQKCLYSTEDLFVDYRAKIATCLIESLPLYDANHLSDKLSNYAAAVPDHFQIKSRLYPCEFNVLNHGDFWSNNIMFRYNEDGSIAETRFIDYQMSRYGSPAQDLYYLLISSTKLENKLKDFEYFIAFYYEKLTESLKILNYPNEFPTLKDLHMSLFRHSDWVYTVVASVMPVLLLDFSENATAENVTDDGEETDEFRKLLFTSSRFVQHMKELLPWMENRGFLYYC